MAMKRAFPPNDVGGQRRRAHRPAGPQVGEVHHDREHQAPVLPEPVEPAQRRLAGRQRVALDLHVQEELRDDAEDRAPQEHEADLRGDVGPQDELAGREPDAGGDDARPDDAPGTGRELGSSRTASGAETVDGGMKGCQVVAVGPTFRSGVSASARCCLERARPEGRAYGRPRTTN